MKRIIDYVPLLSMVQEHISTYYSAALNNTDKQNQLKSYIQCGINANYAKIIAYYCDYVDTKYSPINIFSTYYQGWHFNINRGTNKKDSRISMSENEQNNAKKYFDQALNKKNKNKSYKDDLEKGLQHLGMALHPIQDIYAHTNDKVYLVTYTYVNQYGVKTTIEYWSHVKNKDTDNVFLRNNQLIKTKDETNKILKSFYAKYKSILK